MLEREYAMLSNSGTLALRVPSRPEKQQKIFVLQKVNMQLLTDECATLSNSVNLYCMSFNRSKIPHRRRKKKLILYEFQQVQNTPQKKEEKTYTVWVSTGPKYPTEEGRKNLYCMSFNRSKIPHRRRKKKHLQCKRWTCSRSHYSKNRLIKKFWMSCKNLDNQARSGGPKTVDSKTIEAIG